MTTNVSNNRWVKFFRNVFTFAKSIHKTFGDPVFVTLSVQEGYSVTVSSLRIDNPNESLERRPLRQTVSCVSWR